MTSLTLARSVNLTAAVVVTCIGCGDDTQPSDASIDAPIDAALDAGLDARVPRPITLRASDDVGHIALDTDPLRIAIERADGGVAVQTAPIAFELGLHPTGSTSYNEPTRPTPINVRWSPVTLGDHAEDEARGRLLDADGRSVDVELSVAEAGVYRVRFRADPARRDVALIRLRLAADDGAYHGLGQRFRGPDARGEIVPMQFAVGGTVSGTNEYHVPIPFFVSTHAYGVFAASREAGAFDVAATDPTEVRLAFEGGELELFFYVRETPAEVVREYTRQTGLPRLPPRWAFAPMHWRDEWDDREEVLEDARRIREERIPCSTLWIDNPWQTSYNSLVFDETRFEDSRGLLAELRSRGYMPVLWSTPYLDGVDDGATPTNEAEELFVRASEAGHLIRTAAGEVFRSASAPAQQGGMIDFTNEAASAFWTSRIAPRVADGVRGFKLDYGEDIMAAYLGTRLGLLFSNGETERTMHNVYSVLYHRAYRRALDEGAGDDGGFLIVRASAWGGQSVADIVWPGDLDNDFREAIGAEVGGLPAAVSALQSLAASGFPNFGSDTGGYRGAMPTREALLRWAEHTAFTPILQLGGNGEHHNPWLYDEEAGRIYRTLARAHMDLVPYWRMHALAASRDGTPPVLAPALAFPEDRGSYDDPYAYLLGRDLFVAPVVREGATTRTLRLPPGEWVHFFTAERFAGARELTVAAPLGTPPVFVRIGAILPMLADDLDTLVDVDPPLVDPRDRPWLRARVFAGDANEITTEEGVTLRAARTASGIHLAAASDAAPTSLRDVRFELPLTQASPAIAGVTRVRVDGAEVAASADPADVRDGCADACWALDGTMLYLSVTTSSMRSIEIDVTAP